MGVIIKKTWRFSAELLCFAGPECLSKLSFDYLEARRNTRRLSRGISYRLKREMAVAALEIPTSSF